MPAQLTYPGVYVEEVPSGFRTITGVSTSTAAFVGWAPRGPVDEAGRIFAWGDYDRMFGGLHRDSAMSYAVNQFFTSGGQEAYIVRVADPAAVAATTTVGSLTLTATGPGAWGNEYGVTTTLLEEDGTTHFALTISRHRPNQPTEVVEFFAGLSLDPADPRYVRSVVDEQSQIVNATVEDGGTDLSDVTEQRLGDGEDGEVLDPTSAEFWAEVNPTELDDDGRRGGIYHLERVDIFNLLCVPGLTDRDNLAVLADFCKQHRAFLIADGEDTRNEGTVEPISGDVGTNAALYYPWIRMSDPLQEGRLRAFPPSGMVAGVYARTDTTRGVWKAPAGTDASLTGVRDLTNTLTDKESGALNVRAVNALRSFPVYGAVVWGARTCRGNDQLGSEWKYVPVRRTALFLEESLRRALAWVVFEPNDEPLWAQIRLNVGAFLHDQFRKGAFQGRTPRDAYFVKCDKDTTTQNDVNLGIVNIVVGFAPLKPAEFVVLKLQQMAGQIQS